MPSKTRQNIDPVPLGIHRSATIEREPDNTIVIVIRRKSRIIMKDGERLVGNAAKIQSAFPGSGVKIATTAPVCGKTRAFLLEHGITVESVE